MGREIERTFLVVEPAAAVVGDGVRFVQGYLSIDPDRTVRVRTAGERGYLTIKGRTVGASRAEFEYEIPLADALELLETLCERPLVEKRRHRVLHAGRTWEVDVFDGANAGLVVAEIELDDEDERIELPPWVGAEVTDDPRYLNVNLARRPFRTW